MLTKLELHSMRGSYFFQASTISVPLAFQLGDAIETNKVLI